MILPFIPLHPGWPRATCRTCREEGVTVMEVEGTLFAHRRACGGPMCPDKTTTYHDAVKAWKRDRANGVRPA